MLKLHYHPEKAADAVVGPQIKEAERLVKKYKNRIKKDVVISVGGDGSHIFASKEFVEYELLFIRVEGTKSSNYLPDNSISQLEECLEQLVADDYEVQELPRLEVSLNDEVVGDSLQDAWIERDTNTIECGITVRDEATDRTLWKDRTKLDVLVVYNPLGSSAYSHSVSGPMVEWDTPTIGISQVAPSRSLIGKTGYIFPTHIGDRQATVELVGWKGEGGKLVLDWGKKIDIKHGDKMTFSKSDKSTKLIRINAEPLYIKQLRKVEIDFLSFRAKEGTLHELSARAKEYQ